MEDLKQVLEKHKEEYLQYLKNLISIDTHDLGHGIEGGLEKEGQEYIISLFEKLGADHIKRDYLKDEVIQKSMKVWGEGNEGHNYDDRYNVYGTFLGKGGRSLMFNGHIDTMPAGELEKWKMPPHQPKIQDGRIYGLGSADMKGGLMASVMAVKLLQDAGVELPGDVTITSVCDEEGGGNGSIVAAMNGTTADGVVVCEGTSDELILAHMGFVFFDIGIKGKASHSGSKWLGVSAIEKMIKIIQSLEELEHQWLLTYKHSLLPGPNLNVGVIEGGTAGSTVAGECSIKVCVHYLPKLMNREQVEKEVKEVIALTSKGDSWLKEHPPTIKVYQAGGAFEMEETTSFVESFKQAYHMQKGYEPVIVGSPAGCDSRIWRNIAGCKTIQFGPGNLEQCHAPNEYITVGAYMESILIYAQFILEWCSKEREEE